MKFYCQILFLILLNNLREGKFNGGKLYIISLLWVIKQGIELLIEKMFRKIMKIHKTDKKI
jgi:hypothetical protein